MSGAEPADDVFSELESRGLYPKVVRGLLRRVGVDLPASPKPGDSYAVPCVFHREHHGAALVVYEHLGRVECRGACSRAWDLCDLSIDAGCAGTRRNVATWLRAEYLDGRDPPRAVAAETAKGRKQKDYSAWWRAAREGLDWTKLAESDERFILTNGWSREVLEALEVGFVAGRKLREKQYPPSLVFPIRNLAGDVVGVKLRALKTANDGVKSRTVGPGRWLIGHLELAKRPDGVVVLCAGEKDLVHGYFAGPSFVWVSLAGGEGARLRDVLEAFRGRDVVIWYDADEAGHRGAAARAAELFGVARSVRIVAVPAEVLSGEKDDKDVTDLVKKSGADAAAVVARLVEAATPFDPETMAESEDNDGPLPTDRPIVLVPGEHFPPNSDNIVVSESEFARQVLEQLPPGVIYRRGDVVGELIEKDGATVLALFEVDRARLAISAHVAFAQWVIARDGTPTLRSKRCTRDLAGLVLAAALTSPVVRDLKLLTSYPVYVGLNFALCRPGWNEETGVYYAEPPNLAGLVPANVDLGIIPPCLLDLVIDFPFADEASRQNFFGLLVTALVRAALRQLHTPGHMGCAPIERSGKTKLVGDLFGQVVFGRSVSAMQLGHNHEEQDKRIIALLIAGEASVNFDNLRGEIDSPPLAQLLTSDIYAGRPLGVTRIVNEPNTLVVVATANNIKATGEIIKRFVPIWLQPRTDRPEERNDFRHPDLEGYVASVRREVLAALLGMIEAWKRAGMPGGDRRLGGFEDWARVVGGILKLFGCTDWLTNYRTWVRGADTEGDDFREFVEHWHRSNSGKEGRASELWKLVANSDLFAAIRLKEKDQARITAFGQFLQSKVGVVIGTWRLVDRRRGATRFYRLEDAAGAAPADRPHCVDCGAALPDDGGCPCTGRRPGDEGAAS